MKSWLRIAEGVERRLGRRLIASAKQTFVVSNLLVVLLAGMPHASADTSEQAKTADRTELDTQLVERANSLHNEARHLLDQEEPNKAIDKEKEAALLAPQYWLPHAALAYLYFGRGGPAILEASQSIKTDHPWLADVNLGLILQYFQMYDESIKALKLVPSKAPEFLAAKVGIATSLIGENKKDEGRKLLDEAYACGPKDALLLAAIAKGYFDLEDLNKTKEVCQTALPYSTNPKLTDKLQKLLLVAAAKTADMSVLNSVKEKARAGLLPYERGWLKAQELKIADSPSEGLRLLRAAETETHTSEEWLSYASILQQKADTAEATERKEWIQLVKDCLQNGEAKDPDNVEIRIMLAAIEEKLGQKQVALQKVTAGWKPTTPHSLSQALHANDEQMKSDIIGLAESFLKNANGYHSYLAQIECKLPKVTCRCRYTHIKNAILPLPGVIDVMIGPGDPASALVLFDSRQASKRSIFENQTVVALNEKLEVGQVKPVETIAELGDLTAKFVAPLPAPLFDTENVALQFPAANSDKTQATGNASLPVATSDSKPDPTKESKVVRAEESSPSAKRKVQEN